MFSHTVQVIQVHLFTFCFALRRVKRPVSVSTATTHSSHDSGLLRGGLRKCACVFCGVLCVCVLCVCVCVCVGPQCLISVHMVLFSMLKKCECSE